MRPHLYCVMRHIYLLLPLHTAHMFCGVGQQRHMPRLFKRHAKTALVLSAGPRLAAGVNFFTIRDVPFHEKAGGLLIKITYVSVEKMGYFSAGSKLEIRKAA